MSRERQFMATTLLIVILFLAPMLMDGCAAPTKAPEGPTKVTLTFWAAELDAEAETILRKQLVDFEKQQPELKVELVVLPYDQLRKKTPVAVAARTEPDIIAAPSQLMLAFAKGGVTSVDDAPSDDFIPEAVASNSLNGRLYGIPWHRGPACSPYFSSLGLVVTSRNSAEARKLIGFLSDTARQDGSENSWYPVRLPTTKKAYEALNLKCPSTGIVATLSLDDGQKARQIVERGQVLLSSVLKGQTLNLNGATAAIYYPDLEKGQRDFSREETPPPGKMLAAMAPVSVNLSGDDFKKALGDGVIVGAIFGVDEALEIQVGTGDVFSIKPDTAYAVMLKGTDPQPDLLLVDTTGSSTRLGTAVLQDAQGDVRVPYVTVELGSCTINYRIDDRVSSVVVRNILLGWKLFWLGVSGATILSYSCN